jgi:hypothetical protein
MSKADIIRIIFNDLWNEEMQSLTRAEVSLAEVVTAIRAYNAKHPEARVSDRNPANFYKDLTRRRATANESWPREIFERGFTGRQLVGGGQCFQFVRRAEGQEEPFPETIPGPSPETHIYPITSAVLPVASRRLGRSDEPWLIQVAVRLRIVETHLSLFSPLAKHIVMVDHLQNSVKLRGSEIDAIFLATEEINREYRQLMTTCEVKVEREDLGMDQVLRQPKEMFRLMPDLDRVLPLALRSVGQSRLHLTEFAVVMREEMAELDELAIVRDVLYELRPAVPGIP